MEYDCFLSYNSKDKHNARELKRRLADAGFSVWFDVDAVQVGSPVLPQLEDGIRDSLSVLVLIGADGIGPWQEKERQRAVNLAVRESKRIIPVLGPSAPAEPDIPGFLGDWPWVDLRAASDDSSDAEFERLIRDIPRADGFPFPEAAQALRVKLGPLVGRPGSLVSLDQIYREICEAAELREHHGFRAPEKDFSELGLRGVIDFFAGDAWQRPYAPVKVPLLELAWRVQGAIGEVSNTGKFLRTWIDDVLAQLHARLEPAKDRETWTAEQNLGASNRVAPTASSDGKPDYLAVSMAPGGSRSDNRYYAEVRLLDSRGGDLPVLKEPDPQPLTAMADLLARALGQGVVRRCTRKAERLMHIEFFLPKRLLARDPDTWPAHKPEKTPLSARYPLTIRAWERVAPDDVDDDDVADDAAEFLRNWNPAWRSCVAGLRQLGTPDGLLERVCELERDHADVETLIGAEGCFFLLRFTPDAGGEALGELLGAGVAAALWCSGEQCADRPLLRQALQHACTGGSTSACLADLPAALQRLRRQVYRERKHTGRFHLLWDDPDRKPKFAGSEYADGLRAAPPL